MVLPNKLVIFQDTSTGNATSTWNFGDGSPEEAGSTVSHTYVNQGTYRVDHTITSPTEGSITCSQDIVVSLIPPPVPDIGAILGVSTAVAVIAIIVGTYLLTRK